VEFGREIEPKPTLLSRRRKRRQGQRKRKGKAKEEGMRPGKRETAKARLTRSVVSEAAR